MKKVLITGGAGFIGSNLAERLIKDGYEVVVVDDLSTGKYSNIHNLSCIFYEADINNKNKMDLIFRTERPDYVYHFAAQNNAREED